jgi:hypothetical protein
LCDLLFLPTLGVRFIQSASRRFPIAAKMDFRKLLLIVLICSTAVGCRRDPYVDAYFDMLNAEKRVLEDRLYEAEYNYEKALKELQACRTKPAKPKNTRDDDDRQIPPAETPDLPEVELPPGFDQQTGHFSSEQFRPVGTGVLTSAAKPPNQGGLNIREAVAAPPPSPQPLDMKVAAIHLNARRTGGIELDGMPGDDGIAVLIEPRNVQGQFVARPAALSLVLLDPLKRDDEARFARWDFDRETAQRMLKPDGLDRGLYIRVPWPDVPPAVDRLHLFVRYTTDDERIIEADREIVIRPPDLIADRWTPRAENSAARTASRNPATPVRENQATDSRVVPATHESPVPPRSAPAGPVASEAGPQNLWSPVR